MQTILSALATRRQDCLRHPSLQLNHLRGVDVFTRANFIQQFFARRGVEIQDRERGAAGLISAQRHRGNIHAVIAEQRADAADHPGAICVFQHEHNTVRTSFNRAAVDAHDARCGAKERVARIL